MRSGLITAIEQRITQQLRPGAIFLGENAWQEVEIFILAGHELPQGWNWQDVRSDIDVKNTYFLAFAKAAGTLHLPHLGRKKLMQAALGNWQRIKSRCPEDVGRIFNRL